MFWSMVISQAAALCFTNQASGRTETDNYSVISRVHSSNPSLEQCVSVFVYLETRAVGCQCVCEGERVEWGGATGYMGVSLADAGQLIGFSQREGKCV